MSHGPTRADIPNLRVRITELEAERDSWQKQAEIQADSLREAQAKAEELLAENAKLREALEDWQKTFCHVECFEYIAKACKDEFPEFVDELRHCKNVTEDALETRK